MSAIFQHILFFVALVLLIIAATGLTRAYLLHKQRAYRHKRALACLSAEAKGETRKDFTSRIIRYASQLTRQLFAGTSIALSPSVRKGQAHKTRAGMSYLKNAYQSGCSKEISLEAYCEGITRSSLLGLACGAVLGGFLSNEMIVVLGLAGFFLGRGVFPRTLRRLIRQRSFDAQLHLSEMLEVLALGLRSGMSFDRSFALYGTYFKNDFAQSCTKAQRRWVLGFTRREDALRELAASYDFEELQRVVDTMIRSLRFGSPLENLLEDASMRSRDSYRATLEEKVAKAPVKMMLPTGALILPAMLLLVVGPVLLELATGF